MSDSITSLPQPRPSDGSSRASANSGASGRTDSSDANDSREDARTGSRNDRSSSDGARASSGPADDRSNAARVDVSSIAIDTLDEEALSRLPAGQQEAVKKLHTQVARAVTAIEALATENQRLRDRVSELEEELDRRPDVSDGETVLTLPDDPASLRDTVDHFIDAIDAYLNDDAIPNGPVRSEGSGDSAAAASGGE